MKTIDERIEAIAHRYKNANQYDMVTSCLLREILDEELRESWLDSPDGPGWWWLHSPPSQKPKAILVTEYRGILSGEGGIPVSFWDDSKWQRVIGPSCETGSKDSKVARSRVKRTHSR